MSCPHIPEVVAEEFWAPIRQRGYRERIPLQGSLELTLRCNLRCVHCYVTRTDSVNELYRLGRELDTKEIFRVIDQIVEEGCLFLILTGGEPLLRRDFTDIYAYAKGEGLLLYLFTNGTLLTPELADFLCEWQPRVVEISLYGHTQATYERVTGIPGSYKKCRRGIELLLDRDVPLRLKTMALTLTRHELEDMEAFAQRLGVGFRFDPHVSSSVDGSSEPVEYRLSPEEVLQLDLADARRVKAWQDLHERLDGNSPNRDTLYACGAGLTSFHIDSFGQLSLCMMARQAAYDLRRGSFAEGWHDVLKEARFQKAPVGFACSHCQIRAFCSSCPGWAYMESGCDSEPVEYLCQIAHLRANAFSPQMLSQV
jgi:radical SAM protein with 4Fe4S-binding SPASM domain